MQEHSSGLSTTTNLINFLISFSLEGLLQMLDRALKYILSAL